MTEGYAFDEPSLLLGAPMLDGEVAAGAPVRLPLSMVNRHGLVAGATGTGKTKTLQILAGQLSDAGVPVFVSDVKGDLTGISQPGDAGSTAVMERAAQLGIAYAPKGHPVEMLSLSGALGAQVRATISSLRADPARQGARPQQDPGLGADARIRLLRRPATAVARPRRPAHDVEVPRLRRRQGHARGVRRVLEGHRGGAVALDRRAGSRRRRRVLRRAAVRCPRSHAHDCRTGAASCRCSSCAT